MRQSLRQTTPEIVSPQPAAIRSSQPAPQPIAPLSKPSFRGLSDALMTLQTKLTVGEVGDRFEQEADQTATRVVEQIHAPAHSEATQTAEQSQPLQPNVRKGKNAIPALEASIHQTVGGGQTLPNALQSSMEDAFGQDFQQVRIHADAPAHQLNQSLQSRAFTTQQDIFFRQGSYDPTSRQGQELIAHELAHVVQQSANPSAPAIQRAGDKIAFEAKPTTESADTELIEKIKGAIAQHQQAKRSAKDKIEATKDANIAKLTSRDDKVDALKSYHLEYGKTGWQSKQLQAEILEATNKEVSFSKRGEDEIVITSNKTNQPLYSIFSADQRFEAPTTQDGAATLLNPVYKKKGTSKEYVQDQRDLYITRYVYRGCSSAQMTQLFTQNKMSPRNPTLTIGDQAEKYDFGKRGKNDNITQAEREFLQQRDGSGENQRMLSVTHAKPNRLVHSNHGEVFTSEAVIKIDLAKVDRNKIYNQHLKESHDSKTSLRNKEYDNPARKEMKLYQYSAEKNRETLLVEVPKSAVVEVQIFRNGKLEKVSLSEAEREFNPEIKRQEEQKKIEERKAQEQQEKQKLEEKRQKLEEERKAEERSLREAKKKDEESANNSRYEKIKNELQEMATTRAKRDRKFRKEEEWVKKVIDSEFLADYERAEGKLGDVLLFSTLEALIAHAKEKSKE